MSADLPITDAIRSLASGDDPRHAARIEALARAVAAYLQTVDDVLAGERISMGDDYLTICRTLAAQRQQIASLERAAAQQQVELSALRLERDELARWQHEVASNVDRNVAAAWNLHDDRIVTLEQRVAALEARAVGAEPGT